MWQGSALRRCSRRVAEVAVGSQYTRFLSLLGVVDLGHTPPYTWDFPENFRNKSGRLRKRSSTAGTPKPYSSRHLKPPEHFQNSPASFFRSCSGEDLSELVMEFPAVLKVFLSLVACFAGDSASQKSRRDTVCLPSAPWVTRITA